MEFNPNLNIQNTNVVRNTKPIQDPRLTSLSYMNVVPMMTPNIPPPNMLPFRYDLSLPVVIPVQRSDDELLVETWLSKVGKIKLNLDSEDVTTVLKKNPQEKLQKHVSIHSAKEGLKKCLEITSQLEACQKILEENLSTMTTDEWKQHTGVIGMLKDELTILMTQFQNPDTLKTLNYELSQRRKKRGTLKRRRGVVRLEIVKRNEAKLAEHKRIDLWLATMKEEAERVKSEENMKKDADCVLGEVTKKKTEARKQLALITSLIKLRNVREVAAKARGEAIPAEDNAAFCKTTEMLIRMWENSLRTYGIEEQGLRLMLEQTASEDCRQTRVNREREVAHAWDEVLFGAGYVPSALYWALMSAQQDMEKFVAIRRSWDTFLTGGDGEGSRIPLGWVVPRVDPSLEWSLYRQV